VKVSEFVITQYTAHCSDQGEFGYIPSLCAANCGIPEPRARSVSSTDPERIECPPARPGKTAYEQLQTAVIDLAQKCGVLILSGSGATVWFNDGIATHVSVFVPPVVSNSTGVPAETIESCMAEQLADIRWSCAAFVPCVTFVGFPD
jgi:hypothetical protein